MNRMASEKMSTFAAFIDFRKAFDCINRDLLFYKMLLYNIDGKIFKSIHSLHDQSQSCIKLNNIFTPFFNVQAGVK